MVCLDLTLPIAATHQVTAEEVIRRYEASFLNTVVGARFLDLRVKAGRIRVRHGFEGEVPAIAYLESNLLTTDVIGALHPLLTGEPEIQLVRLPPRLVRHLKHFSLGDRS